MDTTTCNDTSTDNKSTVVSGDDLWGFMEKFPKILNFIKGRNYAEVIINANIVIVNVRNIIGWNNDGNTFKDHITDIKDHPYMCDLLRIINFKHIDDKKPLFIIMIQCMINVILGAMEPVLSDMTEEQRETTKNMIIL
jgi:hypothetical protein